MKRGRRPELTVFLLRLCRLPTCQTRQGWSGVVVGGGGGEEGVGGVIDTHGTA